MTFLTLAFALAAITFTEAGTDCDRLKDVIALKRAFTNTDLDRIAACRGRAEAQEGPAVAGKELPERRPTRTTPTGATAREEVEEDWRARWRSVDQKTRRLRREARELRQEAEDAPRDPKKKPTGRRAPSLLLTRAETLESEARELEDEFQERARREGALPGWLRPKGR